MAIEREKKFTIGNKTFTAKFPNVGQIIDIESFKQALTDNRYGTMAASGVKTMYEALDLVDAVAFYQFAVPEVAKFYDIKNYMTLDIDKMNDLISAYQNEIRPWYNKTMAELKGLATDNGATV